MGRHLWRLLRPAFFWKMLRTRASQLYGWDILLRGTFWPGPVISRSLGNIIAETANAGHEIGLHAWDHYGWQAHIESMRPEAIGQTLARGVDALTQILGHPPVCSAVPAWKCTDTVLEEKGKFSFRYNSDCRGKNIFYPGVGDHVLSQPQVPVTLPTYDEAIGRDGVSPENYNDYLLSLIVPGQLQVLTIHAEVEGIVCLPMFRQFLESALAKGHSFGPLSECIGDCQRISTARIIRTEIPGRQGWVSCQEASWPDQPPSH